MYNEDSFHTLSPAGQIGLLIVSLGFALGLVWVIRRLSRGRGRLVRFEIWSVVFYLFIWLSPQGYYAYYRMMFDGLPLQWVVGWPTSIWDAIGILTFTGPGTLSAHSLGALGWFALLVALWPQRRNCRDAAN